MTVKKLQFKTLLVLVLCTLSVSVKGQSVPVYNSNPLYKVSPYQMVETTILNGDTIPFIHLKPIVVFRRKVDLRRYDRLVRNLKIVYPIAKYANRKLYEMEINLKNIKGKRAQEKYIKQVEKELKQAYTPIIRQMSFAQGKILIKLIDRQTGHTSYELVKEMRGNFSAFFWQGIAKIFGANLKDQYDKEGEDKTIEHLIMMYEAGQL